MHNHAYGRAGRVSYISLLFFTPGYTLSEVQYSDNQITVEYEDDIKAIYWGALAAVAKQVALLY